MSEERFETGKAPHVVVEKCSGALTVGSWPGTAVLASGSDFSGEETAVDQLIFSSAADLTLTVPEKASLAVKECDGPVTIKHVDGIIGVGAVSGAVTLNDVGSVKIKTVGGDFQGENINGPLAIDNASGRVMVRNSADVSLKKAVGVVDIRFVNGAVQVVDAGNDVVLHTISGKVEIGRARGQEVTLSNLGGTTTVEGVRGVLRLTGGLANGEHSFQAKGDIYIAWPVDAPLTLLAEAAVIDNQLPLADAVTTKLDDGRFRLTGHIEQGNPFAALKTTANIGLKPLRSGMAALSAADFDFTPPPLTLDEVVATAVTEAIPAATPTQIEQIADDIEDYLAEKTATPPAPSPGQLAAAKAQQKAEQSLAKAAESIEEAKTRLTEPPAAAAPESKPKTEPEKGEEAEPETAVAPSQTQILTLLKDGLITIEQANTLLNQLKER